MPRPIRSLLLLAAALVVSGCASTTLQDQWRDPGFTGGPFLNYLVLGMGSDPISRRIFEDTMVARLRGAGVMATQGYLVLPDSPPASEAEIDNAVRRVAADALMMTRVRGVQTQTQISTSFVPGPGFGPGWWGMYNAWYPVQQVNQFQIASVETTLFATATRTLVWTGMTQTFNPQSISQEAPGLADVIVRTLQSQRLLPPAK